MPERPIPPRFICSPEREPHQLKEACAWGRFVRYIEFADDFFPLRQVDVYANGNAVAYDRCHWDDRFGTLADFRYGHKWLGHWGEPMAVSEQEFEAVWGRAESMRAALNAPRHATGLPPWIELFNGGRWEGQA